MSFKLAGIGEVLWDVLPSGRQLGGAPANFACHARALGAEVSVITRVGNDGLGREILQQFDQRGLADATVQVDPEAPTGTVRVELSRAGIPNYVIHENVAWDRLTVTPAALNAVGIANAVCFGTLAQRASISRAAIQQLLGATSEQALRVFDINLRQNYFSREVIEQSLERANVLKLNDAELPILAGLFGLTGSTRDQIECVAQKFGLKLVALTRGAAGSLLFQEGRWSECQPVTLTVVDTVGAGDAFTAALVMGLLLSMDLEEINAIAGEVARYVCSQAGATPPLPREFAERFTSKSARFS